MFELHDIDWPYPGLRPFESWEREIFFGRDKHTERLLEILAAQRFLAVIGPSGSGKSSLVRAGLLPELPRGRLGTGTRWRIATLKPGNAPMQHLAAALLQHVALGEALLGEGHGRPGSAAAAGASAGAEAAATEVALLEADLRRAPSSLVEIARRAALRQAQADQRAGVVRPPLNLLVLIDQFEELFTYLEAGGSDAAARRQLADEADAFVGLLLAARAERDARVHVVLTMRADFLGACVRFLDLPEAINRGQYLTPRLQRDEIALAIRGPAELFGGSIAADLVQELINQVGADSDQLPILQHALARMWGNARKRAEAEGGSVQIVEQDCSDVGGIHAALKQHAERVLARLDGLAALPEPPASSAAAQPGTPLAPLPPMARLARELFCAITEQRSAEAGGQTVRRPQALARIAERAGRSAGDYRPVVEAFAKPSVSFLVHQGHHGALGPAAVIDISHEALIRKWDRLAGWVAAEARRAAEYRRLRQLAEQHAAGDVGSGLLGGEALKRAEDWVANGAGSDRDDGWRPTPTWAARYANTPDITAAAAELEVLRAYLAEGRIVEQQAADKREREAQEAQQRQRDAEEKRQRDEREALEREAERQLAAEQQRRVHAEAAATQQLVAEQQRRIDAEAAAASRQRRLSWLLAVMLALAMGLAGWNWRLSREADARRHVIEGQALWIPLRLDSVTLTPNDLDALLRVARADSNGLAAFATQLCDEETLAERFLRAPAAVLQAWVGPSPAARDVALAIFDPRQAAPADPGSARALARSVVRLVLDDTPGQDEPLAVAFANAALAYRGEPREGWRTVVGNVTKLVAPAMSQTRRRAVYLALKGASAGRAWAQVEPLMLAQVELRNAIDAPEAGQLFARLLELLREPKYRAADAIVIQAERSHLLTSLNQVAEKLPEKQAGEAWALVWRELFPPDENRAQPAHTAASATAATGSGGIATVAGVEAAAATEVPATSADGLAPLLVPLALRLQKNSVWPGYDQVLHAIELEVVKDLPLSRPASSALAFNRADRLGAIFGGVLDVLACRLPSEPREKATSRTWELRLRLGVGWKPDLDAALNKLFLLTEPEAAAEAARKLAEASKGKSADFLDPLLWYGLEPHLPSYARKYLPSNLPGFPKPYTPGSPEQRRQAACPPLPESGAIHSSATSLDSFDAQEVWRGMLRNFESATEASALALAKDLKESAKRTLPAGGSGGADVATISGLALAALPRASRAQDVAVLVDSARELLSRQPPSPEVAERLFELLKYPDQPGQEGVTAKALRKLFPAAPAESAGFWALVRWGRTTWPALPLDRRPVEPLTPAAAAR